MTERASNALIGHTGFVGSNLDRQHDFGSRYNSKNIEDIAGSRFDLLVFSGAQAKKWWANANPEADRQGLERAIEALRDVQARQAVLISTIDVLPEDTPHADEGVACSADGMHAYGAHRLWLEQSFRQQFPGCLIVRLPGLFGPGLKKNVIFDLLTGNQLEKINPASSFQYYDLGRLWPDIATALEAGLELVHFFTEPVGTRAVIDGFFPGVAVGSDAAPAAAYDYRTRHGALFGGGPRYIESAASVLERMGAFIDVARRNGLS